MAGFSYNFNGANGPWGGGTWAYDQIFGNNTNPVIASNVGVFNDPPQGRICRITSYSAPNDGYARVTLGSSLDSSSDEGMGPGYRLSSGGNGYWVQASSVDVRLYKIVGGSSYTQIGSTGPACSAGDVIEIRCNGTTISGSRNGSQFATGTDATFASGDAGVWCGSDEVVSLTLFEADALSTGVTGTGALTSPTPTLVAGSGVRRHSGTGALTSLSSLIDGAGTVNGAVSHITGTGALTSPASTSSGSGKRGSHDVGGPIDLTSPASIIAGSGTVNAISHLTGTGALTSPSSSIAGAAVTHHTGTGAINSVSSTIAGSGVVDTPGAVTGTGALTSASSVISGSAIRGITGTGALTSPSSVVAGSGVTHNFQSITGTGALNSPSSQINGTNIFFNSGGGRKRDGRRRGYRLLTACGGRG